jgi:predicted dehydrogenase
MSGPTVLVCGYGAFGARHAAAWSRLGAQVLVCDPSEDARAQAEADGFSADAISAHLDAFLSQADCVAIVTPPSTHLALTKQALAAGKPVLLEKPAVSTLDEAHALMDAQQRTGCLVHVNLLLRAHPMTKRGLEVLQNGDLGNLILMEGRFCGWKRRHLNVTLEENDGVHFLDLMRLFAGASITQISAQTITLPGHDAADDLSLTTLHANGISGRLALGLIVPGDGADAFVPGAQTDKVLKLVGDQGCLTLDYNANRLTFQSVRFDQMESTIDVVPSTSWNEAFPDATPDQLLENSARAFLAAVQDGDAPMVSLNDGALEIARVLAAIPTAQQIACASQVPIERISV